MTRVKFIIHFRLPSLNDYINHCRRNKYEAAKFKSDIEDRIVAELFEQKVSKIKGPCKINFKWYEKNRRRDLDNIYSGKKYILDAMQKSQILENDNQKWVLDLVDNLVIDKRFEGVEVNVEYE